MRSTARFAYAAWLVVAAAGCSDDGLAVQDLNSSSTAGTGVGDSTGNATNPQTSADDEHGTGTATGMGPQDSSGTDTLGLETSGSTTDTPPATSTGDVSTSGTGSTDGSSGSSDGSSSTGEVCPPITEDPTGIGGECIDDADCPTGYICQPFAGIVPQLSCQIPCMQDCECPAGYSCLEVADKSGSTWHQCGLV